MAAGPSPADLVQALTMLASLAKHLPGLSLVPGQAYPYTPNTSFRALRRLMVAW